MLPGGPCRRTRALRRALALVLTALAFTAAAPVVVADVAVPDHRILDVQHAWQEGPGVVFTVHIMNEGTGTGAPLRLTLASTDGNYTQTVPADPLQPGAHANVTVQSGRTFHGIHHFSATLEGDGHEPDTIDNTFNVTFDFGYPDLVVHGFPEDLDVRLGETFVYNVEVMNHGTAPATAIELHVSTDNGTLQVPILGIDELAPGAFKGRAFEWTATKAGTRQFDIRVDPDGRVPEHDENNNRHVADVPVLEPSPMHDLRVDTYSMQLQNGTVVFNVEVEAMGDHPPSSIQVHYERDGTPQPMRARAPPVYTRIGDDYRVQQGVYWHHPGGIRDTSTYNITVVLDPGLKWQSKVHHEGSGGGGTTCCWDGPDPYSPTPGPTRPAVRSMYDDSLPPRIDHVRLDGGEQIVQTEGRNILIQVTNLRPMPVMIGLRLAITAPDGDVVEHRFRSAFFDAEETKTARYLWRPKMDGPHIVDVTLRDEGAHDDEPDPGTYSTTYDIRLVVATPETPSPTTTPPETPEEKVQTQAATTAAPSGRTITIAAATAGAASLLAGAWVWASEARRFRFLSKLMGLPGLFLFSRISKDKVLDHETRERIHQAVQSNPGMHFSGLRRALGLPNGTLVHHLRTLEREGLVKTERLGNRLHFYAVGERARVAVGISPRQDLILRSLYHRPGLPQAELARMLGVSRQALHQHLAPLRGLGLIQDEAHGRTNRLFLDQAMSARLTSCPGCRTTVFAQDAAGVCPSCSERLPAAPEGPPATHPMY